MKCGELRSKLQLQQWNPTNCLSKALVAPTKIHKEMWENLKKDQKNLVFVFELRASKACKQLSPWIYLCSVEMSSKSLRLNSLQKCFVCINPYRSLQRVFFGEDFLSISISYMIQFLTPECLFIAAHFGFLANIRQVILLLMLWEILLKRSQVSHIILLEFMVSWESNRGRIEVLNI